MGRNRLKPVRIVIISDGESGGNVDSDPEVITETGRIEYLGDDKRRVATDRNRNVGNTPLFGNRPSYIAGDRFEEVWSILREVGLFELPRHPERKPPSGEPPAYSLEPSTDFMLNSDELVHAIEVTTWW